MISLSLFCLMLAPNATKQGQSDVQRKMQEIIDRYFIGVGDERRRVYSDKLYRAIMGGTDRRIRQVLEALPGAADYHAQTVEHYRDYGADCPDSQEMMVQGYDIQIDYLAARVARAVRVEPSPETRQVMVQQIQTVISAATAALKERLTGPAAAAYIDRSFERLQRAWAESLSLPFNAFIDVPLTDADLQSTLDAIRKATESANSITLTEADLLSSARLRQLGVEDMIERVKETGYTASQLCFRDYSECERRERQWVADLKTRVTKARMESTRAEKQPLPSTPTPAPKAVVGAPSTDERSEPRPASRSGPISPVEHSSDQGRPGPTKATDPHSGRWLWISLAVLLAGAGIFMRRIWR